MAHGRRSLLLSRLSCSSSSCLDCLLVLLGGSLSLCCLLRLCVSLRLRLRLCLCLCCLCLCCLGSLMLQRRGLLLLLAHGHLLLPLLLELSNLLLLRHGDSGGHGLRGSDLDAVLILGHLHRHPRRARLARLLH